MKAVARILRTATAMLVVCGYAMQGAGLARAEPMVHSVRYTVTAAAPTSADIHYVDHEPAVFSDYSHDPYRFVPDIEVDIAPGNPWTYALQLDHPEQWAMVSVSTGGARPSALGIHCELFIDGIVAVTKEGVTGVLCSSRNW